MTRKTFRELLKQDGPLVMPGAHDGLSARMIGNAGFDSYFIGGFPTVGARYGVPDIGLKSLGEISAAVRDIMSACDLPVFVDADDGYGDVKNVVHTLHTYERMGVQAIMFEDQRWPKRCGHMDGKSVVPVEEMESKVRAASSERINPQTFIFARTDARAVNGLDDALRRAERYIRAGADGIFVEAPQNVKELEILGRAFDVPQIANPLEGGKTPILAPEELYRLGFKVIPYGLYLIMRVAKTMQQGLEDLRTRKFSMRFEDTALSFAQYLSAVGIDDWRAVEARAAANDERA